MMGQAGSLGNNTGVTRMGEFGDIIWDSYLYPKFGHLDNTLMGGMAKALVDELIIKSAAHAHADWRNKAVWALRVS